MRRSGARSGRLGSLIARMKWIWLSVIPLSWLVGCQPQAPDPDYSPPHSPQAALDTFELAPGFKIEVFAAEPLIRDPVAMEVDEDGRIYVVEMGGYPLNTEPIGRIRLLLDQDGDGQPDESRVFADGLVLPTGVMRWKKGILVTAAPDLLYLEDSDGDGRADVRETVLTGFAFSNPQHTVNFPVYGLDNWIYLANEGGFGAIIFQEKFGDRGGRIHYPNRPDSTALEESRSSVRLQPDTGGLENLSAPTQFGHSFDEWGRYFTLNNAVHARHVVIAAPYLRRNPELFLGSAMHRASDHGTYAQVFPITHNPRFELLTAAGEFTSGCSLTHYLGGGFGPELEHFSLVAEPVHNLVHMDVWSESGSTFTASRVHEESEFLASTDNWFRPVFFYNGSDGSIYVVDYYREMIEHPEWTSTRYHQDSEDLYRGTREGRIYRVFPQGKQPSSQPVQLSRTPSRELVSLLGHRNGWWRRTAQRLLVDRQAGEVQPDLMALLESSPRPLARLHALWTLEGLDVLAPEMVLTALSDAHPGVRENAVILSERYLSESDELRERMLGLAADSSQRVRFQVLLSSGFLSSPHARTVRDQLLLEGIADPWVPIAALSASSDEAPRLPRIDHRFGNEGDFGRPERFSESFAIDPVQGVTVVYLVVNGAFPVTECIQAELGLSDGRFRFWGRLIGTELSSAEELAWRFANEGSEDLAVGIGFRLEDPDVSGPGECGGRRSSGASSESNCLTLSASQGGLLQSETTEACMSNVGGFGGQIQPELIGAHRCRAGPVGEQIRLNCSGGCGSPCRPTRTVEVFVDLSGPQAFRRHSDDESGIGAFTPGTRPCRRRVAPRSNCGESGSGNP